jgi:hypothetical protein
VSLLHDSSNTRWIHPTPGWADMYKVSIIETRTEVWVLESLLRPVWFWYDYQAGKQHIIEHGT